MIYRWTWGSRGMQNVIRNEYPKPSETAPPITFQKFYYEAVVNQKVEYFNSFEIATMKDWYDAKLYNKIDRYNQYALDTETLMSRYMKLRKGLLVAELALLQSFLLKNEIPVGNSYIDYRGSLPTSFFGSWEQSH